MTLKIEAILHRPSYFILEPQQHSGWCNAALMPNTAFCRLWFGDYANLSKFGWLFVTFLTAWTWTYNDSFEGILWGSLLGACSYAPQTQLVFQWDWKDDWLEISLNLEDSKVVWRNWSGHASYSEIWAPEKIGWHWHQCKWSDMPLLIFWSCSRSVLFAVSQILHSTFHRLLSRRTIKAARGHMPCEGSNVYHLESSQTARIHNETGASMICILDHYSGFKYEYGTRLQKWL